MDVSAWPPALRAKLRLLCADSGCSLPPELGGGAPPPVVALSPTSPGKRKAGRPPKKKPAPPPPEPVGIPVKDPKLPKVRPPQHTEPQIARMRQQLKEWHDSQPTVSHAVAAGPADHAPQQHTDWPPNLTPKERSRIPVSVPRQVPLPSFDAPDVPKATVSNRLSALLAAAGPRPSTSAEKLERLAWLVNVLEGKTDAPLRSPSKSKAKKKPKPKPKSVPTEPLEITPAPGNLDALMANIERSLTKKTAREPVSLAQLQAQLNEKPALVPQRITEDPLKSRIEPLPVRITGEALSAQDRIALLREQLQGCSISERKRSREEPSIDLSVITAHQPTPSPNTERKLKRLQRELEEWPPKDDAGAEEKSPGRRLSLDKTSRRQSLAEASPSPTKSRPDPSPLTDRKLKRLQKEEHTPKDSPKSPASSKKKKRSPLKKSKKKAAIDVNLEQSDDDDEERAGARRKSTGEQVATVPRRTKRDRQADEAGPERGPMRNSTELETELAKRMEWAAAREWDVSLNVREAREIQICQYFAPAVRRLAVFNTCMGDACECVGFR